MAELQDLFCHRSDFTPAPPTHISDMCKCSHCQHVAPFSDWIYLNGMGEGVFCESCNDFHSCFQCPTCNEMIGAAGHSNGFIEVIK